VRENDNLRQIIGITEVPSESAPETKNDLTGADIASLCTG